MRQVLEYKAWGGPNSNTLAFQVLRLAVGKGETSAGQDWASGWNYAGPYRYGGQYYDEYGHPKEKYINAIEAKLQYLKQRDLFGQAAAAIHFLEGQLAYAKSNESGE